jgi:ParB family chromosome partitioning protein
MSGEDGTAGKPKRGLGRGLASLMADVQAEPVGPAAAPPASAAPQPGGGPVEVPIERIHPNPDQPRRSFDEAGLEDLAQSIRARGVIQPLIVRPNPRERGTYEIVAGERRWRAAQRAQLHNLPVILRDYDEIEVLEIAIIENIQRADLNPIEEAQGFQQLMGRFGHTQEKLAEALGKSRSHISNLTRLLSLPEDVQGLLRDGRLSAGHARALVGNPEASALAARIVAGGLSVREAEKLTKKERPGGGAPKGPAPSGGKDADTRALEGDLSAALGMGVSIDHPEGAESGSITIRYKSLDELDDLCRKLGG